MNTEKKLIEEFSDYLGYKGATYGHVIFDPKDADWWLSKRRLELSSLLDSVKGMKEKHYCDEMCNFQCDVQFVENNTLESVESLITNLLTEEK